MKPDILAVDKLPAFYEERLRAAFSFHDRVQQLDPAAFVSFASKVRGIAARAMSTVTREFIAQLPALEIISVFGVGYDGIDVQAAHERGIVVTHTPDVLTDDVADLCLGLILSVAREIPAAERFLRQRRLEDRRLPAGPQGKRQPAGHHRVGTNRPRGGAPRRRIRDGDRLHRFEQKPDVSYRYYASLLDLAANTDFLVAAAYGGPTTRGLVNAAVLHALGPEGFLINIARGSLVDEPALMEALKQTHDSRRRDGRLYR